MEPVILALIAAATGLGALAAGLAESRIRERAWRHAAAAAGLTDVRVETRAGFVSSLSGEAGPLGIRIERYWRGKHEKGSRIVVSGLGHAPDELALRREGMASAVGKALGNREIVLGDPWFDQTVYLQGSAELACAVLDDDTRLRVVQMLDGTFNSWWAGETMGGAGGPESPLASKSGAEFTAAPRKRIRCRASLADGELRIELPGRMGQSRCRVVLPSALVTAERLVRPEDLAQRLADNLEREPVEGVRLTILMALIERHAGHPAARAALERAARRDGSEEVRLRAGLTLGSAGRDALLEIASSETSDDGRAARAIAGLGDDLDAELAKRLLDHALLTRRLASAQACLARLGRVGGADVVRRLARILVVEEGVVAVAAVRAAGATGEPGAEAVLIEALGRQSSEVATAVADELGRMGTAAAVMPLRAAAERRTDGDFRRAARQAIASIQSRLQGAAPGQLSLAAGEAGQVSLTGDDSARGRVSLDDPDGAQ